MFIYITNLTMQAKKNVSKSTMTTAFHFSLLGWKKTMRIPNMKNTTPSPSARTSYSRRRRWRRNVHRSQLLQQTYRASTDAEWSAPSTRSGLLVADSGKSVAGPRWPRFVSSALGGTVTPLKPLFLFTQPLCLDFMLNHWGQYTTELHSIVQLKMYMVFHRPFKLILRGKHNTPLFYTLATNWCFIRFV